MGECEALIVNSTRPQVSKALYKRSPVLISCTFLNLTARWPPADNLFSEIQGLTPCRSLTHLSLAHNQISAIRGLGGLPLKRLCLVRPRAAGGPLGGRWGLQNASRRTCPLSSLLTFRRLFS